ncbi:hypothetical protein N7E02_17695 [Aliirhizobium terrae]|uniref:hypothetical protein n=1 Tax=Terrirhizobium terrae TaxID=2926709 RepID=UPI002576EA4E|nr:hypothetical protein [Rhizobium sp. CC-CFT758]WJH42028.1 hypothetical protein N7E02_17695 [Rhizobium sp. CC-CFT758]
MAAWISVAIGLVVALVMIAASIWWSFRPRPKGSRSFLPDALDNRNEPNNTIVTGTGNDFP